MIRVFGSRRSSRSSSARPAASHSSSPASASARSARGTACRSSSASSRSSTVGFGIDWVRRRLPAALAARRSRPPRRAARARRHPRPGRLRPTCPTTAPSSSGSQRRRFFMQGRARPGEGRGGVRHAVRVLPRGGASSGPARTTRCAAGSTRTAALELGLGRRPRRRLAGRGGAAAHRGALDALSAVGFTRRSDRPAPADADGAREAEYTTHARTGPRVSPRRPPRLLRPACEGTRPDARNRRGAGTRSRAQPCARAPPPGAT